MQKERIPKYVDNPPKFLFWEQDEFMLMMLVFVIVAIVMKKMFLSLLIMWVVGRVFRAIKNASHRGAFLHLLYWWGIGKITSKHVNGQVRELSK